MSTSIQSFNKNQTHLSQNHFANSIELWQSQNQIVTASPTLSLKLANSHRFLIHSTVLEEQKPIKEGSISILSGFLPSSPLPTCMPDSHQVWDQIAMELPSLLRNYQLVDAVNKMPLLEADFPDRYLDRASVLISALSHAYCFQNKKQLPPQLEVPWRQITLRLQRPRIMRTASDDFLHNWRYKDATLDHPMQIENLDTLVPYFFEQEDKIMTLTIILTEYEFSPALKHIVYAQTAVLNNDDDTLAFSLDEVSKILKKIIKVFSYISPNPYSPYYMDPVIWAKTFAVIGTSTREGELGNSGVSLPLFHLMDAFIGRNKFLSDMGSQMIERAGDLPKSHKRFIKLVNDLSVHDYVQHSTNDRLKIAFDNLLEMYTGESGLLNVHRKKAFGYIKLAMQSGRLETNNENVGEKLEQSQTLLQWENINNLLNQGRDERLTMHCNGKFHSIKHKDIKKLNDNVYQITLHLEENANHWMPGDKLSLIPENSLEDIQLALSVFNNTEQKFKLSKNWEVWFRETFGKTMQDIDLQTFFTYADLKHIFMESSQTKKIVHFSEFLDHLQKENPQCNIEQSLINEESPFYLLTLLKPLQARLYSLTTIDNENNTNSLTVSSNTDSAEREGISIADQANRCPFARKVASSYLSYSKSVPRVFHEPSFYFTIPENPKATIFMFASGTGIAPFINFIKKASNQSKLFLYYSVKSDSDFLYKEQLISWAEEEKIDLKVLFSQMGTCIEIKNGVLKEHHFTNAIHIDKVLDAEQDALKKFLIDGNTYIYICGSTGFQQTLHNSFKKSLNQMAISLDYLSKLVAEDRYISEVYDSTDNSISKPKFSRADVAMHNRVNDCWLIIQNQIYNFSEYVKLHPGGIKIIMTRAGLDGSSDFDIVHSKEQGVQSRLTMYLIGQLLDPVFNGKKFNIYHKYLGNLLSIVELQNTQFNNSSFNKEVSFRLFEMDWISYFINNIRNLETQLIRNSDDQEELKEKFNDFIFKTKNALSVQFSKIDNNAQHFIKIMWQLNRQLLTSLQEVYYENLKFIEDNKFESVEEIEKSLDDKVSLLFKNYWDELKGILSDIP